MARDAPTRLLVIRHGQSEWNIVGRWQGRADTALSSEGRRQAMDAASSLGVFDGIWSSDLQRAAETAAIIAAEIGIGPVVVDPRLGETDVGPWQGLTHDEIEAGWPGFLAAYRRPPEAETHDAVAARVAASFAEIAATVPGAEMLVITHAGVLRTMCHVLGEPPHRFGNLAGRWFDVHTDATIVPGAHVELIGSSIPVADAL